MISRLVWKLLCGNNICNINFRDAIAIIYDEMVLRLFIHTIAKPHGKRLTVWLQKKTSISGQSKLMTVAAVFRSADDNMGSRYNLNVCFDRVPARFQ